MSYEEELLELIGPADWNGKNRADDGPEADRAVAEQIKRVTFAKLGLSVPAFRGRTALRRSRRIGLAASAAALVVLVTVLFTSPTVRAELLKQLRFIPGFGAVQSSETLEPAYVLDVPVVIPTDKGNVTVRAVYMDDKVSTIDLTGAGGTPQVTEINVTNADGQSYLFNRGTMQWGGEWAGSYYIRGKIHITNQMTLHLSDMDKVVTVHLSPAKQVSSMAQLGPTAVANGIEITAVSAALHSNETKVTLLNRLPDTVRINSYGISPYSAAAKPQFTDADGKPVAYRQEPEFPLPNELIFKADPAAKRPYHLIIGSFEAVKQTDGISFRVPIPDKDGGAVDIGQTIEVLGHPVELVKAERIGGSLRMYFDMHYNSGAGESLLAFWPDFTAASQARGGSGGSMKMNEMNHTMEFVTVEIPDGAKTYPYKVKEATLLIRGPWEFDLPAVNP